MAAQSRCLFLEKQLSVDHVRLVCIFLEKQQFVDLLCVQTPVSFGGTRTVYQSPAAQQAQLVSNHTRFSDANSDKHGSVADTAMADRGTHRP